MIQRMAIVGVAVLLAISTISCGRAGMPPTGTPSADKDFGSVEKRQSVLTISKETTYITEPLDGEGYPDYAAALNKRQSDGVTPKNNAVVLLLQTCGLKDACWGLTEGERAKYFRLLSISPPREQGLGYIGFYDYVKGRPDAQELEAAPYDKSVWQEESQALRGP